MVEWTINTLISIWNARVHFTWYLVSNWFRDKSPQTDARAQSSERVNFSRSARLFRNSYKQIKCALHLWTGYVYMEFVRKFDFVSKKMHAVSRVEWEEVFLIWLFLSNEKRQIITFILVFRPFHLLQKKNNSTTINLVSASFDTCHLFSFHWITTNQKNFNFFSKKKISRIFFMFAFKWSSGNCLDIWFSYY